jgi:hypothetical protein
VLPQLLRNVSLADVRVVLCGYEQRVQPLRMEVTTLACIFYCHLHHIGKLQGVTAWDHEHMVMLALYGMLMDLVYEIVAGQLQPSRVLWALQVAVR